MIPTRRQFLSTLAAGTCALGLPNIGSAAQDDPFGGWPIGIQSFSLRGYNFVDAVRHIEGMGIHYVEFFKKHVGMDISDAELDEVKAILSKANIKMNAYGVMGFTASHEKNREVFEFAKRIGVKNITANPKPDSFDSLDKLVEEYDIRIAIHNHGPGALYDKIDDVVKAVKDHHPLVGACVDTGHFIRSKEDPITAIKTLGSRVFAVHVKDEEKQEKKSKNVIIGEGFLDLSAMFTTLKSINFPADGSISLEYESNPDNPIDDINQCLAAAKAAIKKAAG